MKRVTLPAALICALLATPGTAFSQKEPDKTKEVKEAERFIASAMLTTDTVEKKSRLQRALNPLIDAMAKNPENGRVWLAAGQVYVGLREYQRADSALSRAVELHPGFAEEAEEERFRAWAEIFMSGSADMDQQRYDEAIAQFELAEKLYSKRPESKINLGALYANKGDLENAEKLFREAIAATDESARAGLGDEDVASYKRLNEMSTIQVARMLGERGIMAFEAEKYDDAIEAFRAAYALNPHSRDFSYNLAQAFYAKAITGEKAYTKLVEEEKAARLKKDLKTSAAKVEEAKQLSAEIVANYAEIEPLIARVRSIDPANEEVYRVLMRSFRTRTDLTTEAAKKTEYNKRTDDLLKQHALLTSEISGVAIFPGSDQATIKGKLHNLKLAAGTEVKLHMTLIGLDGRTVGETDISVKAPAADETVDFEAVAPTTGDVAGWKYEMVK